MSDNPYKILVLSPYEGFEHVFRKAIRDRDDISADIYSAPLNEIRTVLESIDSTKYEAVICRGRSAWEAARLVSRPVITVEFSPIDILRSMELASLNREKRMAFVSFFEMEHTIRLIAEFLRLPINRFLIPPAPADADDMHRLIRRLHEEHGVDLFIGDGACTRAARDLGLEYVLITSGIECLDSAVSQAVEVCRMGRALKQESTFYQQILFGSDDQLAILSQDKDVIGTNLPNTQISAQIISSIKAHLSRIIHHGSIRWVVPTNLASYKITGQKIDHGGRHYALCHISSAFQAGGQNVSFIKYKEASDVLKDLSLITSTPALNRFLSDIRENAPDKTPVMITGSPGTGKISLARSIYAASSSLSSCQLVEIDCQGLEKRNLLRLLNEDSSPLYDPDNVIILKNLEAMPMSFQLRLADVLQSMELTRRVKFISTVSGPLKSLIPSNQLSPDLVYELNGHSIHIPELHEAPELAVTIARQYLNQLNQELSNQVAGFDPGALELLTNFHWNYGIPQYKLTIKQLAKAASGQFITEQEVRDALNEIDDASQTNQSASSSDIDLHADLQTITHQIILKVLQEEDMNQTRAAKRLGVSRMTIWKHLNSEEAGAPETES
ncbi:MAG: PrpR N-terminal domain-containing protein [Lachnospiraceae bacterium]|nr:PrpR N-terminal domain-containing protein [Lachnospiraceae bacterium]